MHARLPVRRTKIIATVGPATQGEETLARLVEAGVDVFRLNFSHGTHEEHAEVIRRIRRVAADLGRPVGILQDLQGPRVRTGALAGGRPVELRPGAEVVLTVEPVAGTPERIPVDSPDLPREVRPGDRLLLADGTLELEVLETTPEEVRTRVVRGGLLEEHKGINLPSTLLHRPALSEKDREDLAFGVRMGVDFVALSFVRSGRDLEEARRFLREELGTPHMPLIAKIETAHALRNLDSILRNSQGVMVARGDLGVEVGPEKVPVLQKLILRQAHEYGVLSITATQMLTSMTYQPRPTRAEASDAANAILDGSDALMLSEETAVGKYPVEAVETLDRIAREVEGSGLAIAPFERARRGSALAYGVARAGCLLAREVGARALVVFTRSGFTAQILSKERPPVPIYAFTASPAVYRRLALWHGVVPLYAQPIENTDALIEWMQAELLRQHLVQEGDTIVVVRLSPPNARRHTNLITVRTVQRPPREPLLPGGPTALLQDLPEEGARSP